MYHIHNLVPLLLGIRFNKIFDVPGVVPQRFHKFERFSTTHVIFDLCVLDRIGDVPKLVDMLGRHLIRGARSAKSGQRIVNLALRKLTQSPLVAKRLAAACHPDKVPSELSDVATELFRFVQSIRDDR